MDINAVIAMCKLIEESKTVRRIAYITASGWWMLGAAALVNALLPVFTQ